MPGQCWFSSHCEMAAGKPVSCPVVEHVCDSKGEPMCIDGWPVFCEIPIRMKTTRWRLLMWLQENDLQCANPSWPIEQLCLLQTWRLLDTVTPGGLKACVLGVWHVSIPQSSIHKCAPGCSTGCLCLQGEGSTVWEGECGAQDCVRYPTMDQKLRCSEGQGMCHRAGLAYVQVCKDAVAHMHTFLALLFPSRGRRWPLMPVVQGVPGFFQLRIC